MMNVQFLMKNVSRKYKSLFKVNEIVENIFSGNISNPNSGN